MALSNDSVAFACGPVRVILGRRPAAVIIGAGELVICIVVGSYCALIFGHRIADLHLVRTTVLLA